MEHFLIFSFFDHVANEISFTTDTAIILFESEYDPKEAFYFDDTHIMIPSPVESLCRIMENTSSSEMIARVNILISK